MSWLVAGLLPSFSLTAANQDWPDYLRGQSPESLLAVAHQIDARNVGQLKLAWTYHAGDARDDNLSQIQCNPLIIDGVLYGTTPQLKLVALQADTGHELWRADPFAGSAKGGVVGVNRGVVYWADGNDRRIFFSADHFLYAIAAATGRPVPSFGTNGHVDIKEGLGRDVTGLFVVSTSPGVIYSNLLFLPLRRRRARSRRARPSPRLRRPDRQNRLDLSHDSIPRRARCRYLAAGRLDLHRRRQLLGGHVVG